MSDIERIDDYATARKNHIDLFWGYLVPELLPDVKSWDDPEIRAKVKGMILGAINEGTEELKNGMCRLPMKYASQMIMGGLIIHVMCFDTSFKYRTGENDATETDILTEESAFQSEIYEALDAYILEGAALARKLKSSSYEKWTEAMIMLSTVPNSFFSRKNIAESSADTINALIAARQQLWADIRVVQKSNHA